VPVWYRTVRSCRKSVVVALARGAGPVSGVGVGADEAGDEGAEPFAGVFLQEVAGAGDHRVVDAGRAGQATSVPALPQLSSAAAALSTARPGITPTSGLHCCARQRPKHVADCRSARWRLLDRLREVSGNEMPCEKIHNCDIFHNSWHPPALTAKIVPFSG
jgi:hypothetical protein